MATEIAFSATVETGEGAKSLRSLKEEFKNTQKELDGLTVGSEKYVQTLQKLGKVKDEIADLNEEIAAFDGGGQIKALGNIVGGIASGFQAATGAAALFGSEGEDLQKTLVKIQSVMAFTEGLKGIEGLGQSFKAFGQALKTNPIMLFATILAGVGAALFALKDKVSVIGDAFDFLGSIVNGVVQGFKDFTDWIGITSNASDDLADKTIKNAQLVSKATTERYDLEIAKANAAGENTLQLEKKKQEAIIQSLRVEAEAIVAAAKARGNFTEEENKRFTELIALTKKAANEITLIDIKANKEREDEQAKQTEKNKQNLEKRKADREKHEEELQKFRDAEAQWDEEQAKKKKERDLELFNIEKQLQEEATQIAENELAKIEKDNLAKAELNALQNQNDLAAQLTFLEAKKQQELSNTELTENERLLISEKYKQQELELTKKYKLQEAQESLQIAQQSTQALQGLSDLFFSIKMANVKKGSKEEEAAARKQFKINKALSIASTLISGAQGVVNGLSAPYPQNIILPVLAGITTAASIAKISATQYEGGGSSVGSSNIASMNTGGLNQPAPTLNAPNTGSTMLNPDGTVKTTGAQQQQPIQAYVVETQLTTVQGNVAAIENAAVH